MLSKKGSIRLTYTCKIVCFRSRRLLFMFIFEEIQIYIKSLAAKILALILAKYVSFLDLLPLL